MAERVIERQRESVGETRLLVSTGNSSPTKTKLLRGLVIFVESGIVG